VDPTAGQPDSLNLGIGNEADLGAMDTKELNEGEMNEVQNQ